MEDKIHTREWSKFWKKVEQLQKAYGYDDETVLKYFYLLLDGHALEWYWQFTDQRQVNSLRQLKREFLRVFKPRETDMNLISAMYNHKQRLDSFEKFYNDLVDMNFSLRKPLTDPHIIEILRTSMDDEIRQRMFTFETGDRIHFFHKANKAYLDVCGVKESRKNLEKPARRINELTVPEFSFDDLTPLEIDEISEIREMEKESRRAKMLQLSSFRPFVG